MKKKYLPVSIDITNQKILVLGGDTAAFNKVKILLRSLAEVEVVARKVVPEITALKIPVKIKSYEPSDLDGYLMVYSCLNDEILDRQVVADARKKGILVNIHDKPALCQFISPAIFRWKHMTVSVASDGQNVYQSIRLRNHLQNYLSKKIEKIIEL